MRRAAAGLAMLATLAGISATAAAQPRSAIPWLSDSVDRRPVAPPMPRPKGPAPDPGATAGPRATAPAGDPDAITVTTLDPISLDAVGLLPPAASGLPRALWGDASALRVRSLILDQPDAGGPAARALFRRVLLAEADPPQGSSANAIVLLARLDRLLALGALDEAEALLEAAGADSPELFRRWFDVGLLTGRTEGACAALRGNPALSPTFPARVFCLARGGDWNAAEITLTLGTEMGAIPPDRAALLARFLDPELFEGEPAPPAPDPLTPLDFLLREAVALPRAGGTLPLAFLQGDLDQHAPMRTRIEASERLALAGTLPPERLFEAYRAGAPAASGGLWDRARAVQALDAALAGGDPVAVAAALAAADAAFAARDLRPALAVAYGPALARLDPAELPAAADEARLGELLLLAGGPAEAVRAFGPEPTPDQAALLAIAGAGPAPDAAAIDPKLRAALSGLAARPPADPRETRIAELLTEGRTGEAILAALALAAPGPGADPRGLEAGLHGLAAAGFPDAARGIALEALLAPPPG